MPGRTYRCSNCLDATVDRPFDSSHLMVKCGSCGEFGRFINRTIVDQYEAFEATPPGSLDWDRLDRMEKLLVAERIARTDRTIEDVTIEELAEADDPE